MDNLENRNIIEMVNMRCNIQNYDLDSRTQLYLPKKQNEYNGNRKCVANQPGQYVEHSKGVKVKSF